MTNLAPNYADQYLDFPGLQLRFIEAGSGEPVIFIHGFMSDLEEQWIKTGVFAHLARRFHVVAYDNRGHGKSTKFHDAGSYGSEMVRDVFRVMAAFGFGKAHIVGYSMGANIVARALADGSGRLLSATLAGAAGRYAMSADERARYQMEAGAIARGDATGHILRMWPSDQVKPTSTELKSLSDSVLAGKDAKAFSAVRLAMQPLVVNADDLARCREPVLGVIGSRDPHLAGMELLKTRMPHLQLVEVTGATHANLPGTSVFKSALEAFVSHNAAR